MKTEQQLNEQIEIINEQIAKCETELASILPEGTEPEQYDEIIKSESYNTVMRNKSNWEGQKTGIEFTLN